MEFGWAPPEETPRREAVPLTWPHVCWTASRSGSSGAVAEWSAPSLQGALRPLLATALMSLRGLDSLLLPLILSPHFLMNWGKLKMEMAPPRTGQPRPPNADPGSHPWRACDPSFDPVTSSTGPEPSSLASCHEDGPTSQVAGSCPAENPVLTAVGSGHPTRGLCRWQCSWP